MSNTILPPDSGRADAYNNANVVAMKYLRSDGSITAPDKTGTEVSPPSTEGKTLWDRMPATATKALYPDGSIFDADPASDSGCVTQAQLTEILSTMPGIARVVYESNQVMLNSGFTMLDTGVEFVDGTNYQIIISAMAGTTGTSSISGNAIRPCLINGDGSLNSLIGNTTATTMILRAMFNIRYQERAIASNSANKSVNIMAGYPAAIVASGVQTTSVNADIDAATGAALSVTSPSYDPIVTPATNKLRIGFAVSGTPNSNARMLCKVIETRTTESVS